MVEGSIHTWNQEVMMARQDTRYSKARQVFLALFIVSTVLALAFVFFFVILPARSGPGKTPTTTQPNVPTIGELVAIVGSCITSVVTLVGFVSTTILAWRKEAREAAEADLEKKRKEIELEKEKLELERLRAEQQKNQKKDAK
jgi:H+/gluconate symporter-like permease